MGGEEYRNLKAAKLVRGLPPRGRGRGHGRLQSRDGRGITPAWAGKSHPRYLAQKFPEDYPRVGGEEACSFAPNSAILGLPPRGRGRVMGQQDNPDDTRITPAWAGKRPCVGLSSMGLSDYPRVGGEEFLPYPYPFPKKGLPPRGRGRVDVLNRCLKRGRITPAWAGKRN